jgi:hypothetical protein
MDLNNLKALRKEGKETNTDSISRIKWWKIRLYLHSDLSVIWNKMNNYSN